MSRWSKALSLRFMSALFVALACFALAFLSIFAASCGNTGPARVRFVHAIEDAGAMDVDINGSQDFVDISFLGVLPNQPGYTSVPSGNDTLEAFATGTSTEVFTSTLGLGASVDYSVVATGFSKTGTDGSNVVLLSIPDNTPTPPAADVGFRVIHASPSGPTVDVYIELNPSNGPVAPIAIQGLAYTQASKYVFLVYNPDNDQPPPGFTVYVTQSGSLTPIIAEPINPGALGAVRTLVLTDVQNGNPPAMSSSFLELSDAN
ncbi:MAG: DUF4397 domain-containing protein [Terriglobales bacterium]|jgi:hypothetical protein